MRAAARQLKRGVVDLYWRFRGPRIQVPEIPADPRSILFVCKGNICRSPFAEHLASKLQRDGMNSGIKFGSAGLHVPKPTPSPESAIQVARQFGVELENHRSQSISLELVKSYDMIIAMEVWQYAELQSSFGQHQGKLFLLPLLMPMVKPKSGAIPPSIFRTHTEVPPAPSKSVLKEWLGALSAYFRRSDGSRAPV